MGRRRGSRSTRLVAKRALAMLARLLEGEATRQELLRAVVVEMGEEAYGESPVDSFHRDCRFLRQLGFEVRYRRSLGTYYLAGQSHPSLRLHLSPAELEVLAAIRNAFRGLPHAKGMEALMTRIETRLPPESRQALRREPLLSFSFGPAGELEPHEGTLRVVERAIKSKRQLMFEYRSPIYPEDELPKRHVVEAYDLEYRDGHLYFQGRGVRGGEVLTYRVDRIVPGSARVLPTKFVPRQRLHRWRTIRYRLAPEIARFGASKRFLNQREEKQPDGSVIVTGETHDLFDATRKLLKYGSGCQVLEPPELVAEMKRVVREMAKIYEIGEGGE